MLKTEEEQCMLYFEKSSCIHSGKNKRYFYGTSESYYLDYLKYSKLNNQASVSFTTFEKWRNRERVGLKICDIFYDDQLILLKNKKSELKELESIDQPREKEIDVLIEALKEEIEISNEVDEFARKRIKEYRECVQSLKEDERNEKIILTIDFTGIQTRQDKKFACFVIVINTHSKLEISKSLKEILVMPEKPISEIYESDESEVPQREKKFQRRTKQQLALDGYERPKERDNLQKDKREKKKERKLDPIEETVASYKPNSLYFYFIAEKSSENSIPQTFPYVQWSLDLLCEHHVFDNLQRLSFGPMGVVSILKLTHRIIILQNFKNHSTLQSRGIF